MRSEIDTSDNTCMARVDLDARETGMMLKYGRPIDVLHAHIRRIAGDTISFVELYVSLGLFS